MPRLDYRRLVDHVRHDARQLNRDDEREAAQMKELLALALAAEAAARNPRPEDLAALERHYQLVMKGKTGEWRITNPFQRLDPAQMSVRAEELIAPMRTRIEEKLRAGKRFRAGGPQSNS